MATEISIENYRVSEYERAARVTVRLSEAETTVVRVRLSTQGNTAVPGQDFYGMNQVIDFAPGETKKLVPISILNDTEIEEQENFTARLWGAEGASITTSVATIRIDDDDGDGVDVPTVSLAPVSVNESDGSADVEVSLSVPANRSVTAVFSTTPDTATPGQDFYGAWSSVRFAIGETKKVIPVTILDDDLSEGDERFNVHLNNIIGAVVGTNASFVTVVDDDVDPTDGTALKVHVQNRIGFGPGPDSEQQIESLGVRGYIESQFDRSPTVPLCDRCEVETLIHEKIRRAVSSQSQLIEVLVDFWFNHFNVDTVNRVVRFDLGRYEAEAIRQNIFNDFENMLIAVAKSPTMLTYLDNRTSTKEGFRNRNGIERGLNENYARELMELHTLGESGGYNEDDVIAVARILTGWTIRRGGTGENYREFNFSDRFHDTGPKTVMGGAFTVAANQGVQEGEKLLRFLARHPSTARHVSSRLIQRFVSETPPAALVDAAAATWMQTNGNLREVLRTILLSDEFLDATNFDTKIKSPMHLLASATRAMNRTSMPDNLLESYRRLMLDQGQEMYQIAPPIGIPEETKFWISTAAMLARFDSMKNLAGNSTLRGGISIGNGDNASIVTAVAKEVQPQGISVATRDVVTAHLDGLAPDATLDEKKMNSLMLLMSSPEFMRH